jgi:hypothetical protein
MVAAAQHPWSATCRAVAVALLVLVEVACGRKAPPLPPIILVAEQTRDLAVHQEGMDAVLRWSYPSMTTAGSPLADLESIEVWRTQLPVAQEPRGTSSRDRTVQVQLLESGGEQLQVLTPELVELATRGALLEVRDDLGAWQPTAGQDEPLVLWYAVRTWCCRGRPSQFSNIARLEPRPPPAPPEGLVLEATPTAVRLQWQPVDELSTIVERSADEQLWERVADDVRGGEWEDAAADQGRAWFYRLRSLRVGEDGSRVVGGASAAADIEYLDRFPPAAPTSLVCLPEGPRARLRWDRVEDAVAYRIDRQARGGPRETIASRWVGAEHTDDAPPRGTLVYSVVAIDAAGNESEPATCSAVVGPAS